MFQMFHSIKELPVKASQLKLCFYCPSPLPASHKEHIFNACWGGSHKTGQLICDDCNDSFSIEEVDSACSIYTEAIMNAELFKGPYHKSIPTIKLEGDYDLSPGAKQKLKKPLIEEETQADGSIKYNISFNSKGEAKRWVRDDSDSGAKSLFNKSLSQEEQDLLISKISNAEFQSDEPQPQRASAEINLRKHYRSAAHTRLKCLGLFMPDWVNQEKTKKVRQFARYNEGDWQLFAVQAEQYISLATHTVELLELGVKHNSVEIYFCSHLRMVIGVLTILNRIKRSVVIATDYSGSDKILYVFEDTHGSGKPPRGILAEINSQEFSLPTIGIQYFTSPQRIDQYFNDEISKLAGFDYPLDANDAELRKTLDSLKNKSVKVNEEILEQYRQAFLRYFLNRGKILGKSINSDKVLSKMSDHGLTASSAHNFTDKKCCDTDFQSFITKVFANLANEFVQDSLS